MTSQYIMSLQQHFQCAIDLGIKEQNSSNIQNPTRPQRTYSSNFALPSTTAIPSTMHGSRNSWNGYVQENYGGVRARGESANHRETMQQLANTYNSTK